MLFVAAAEFCLCGWIGDSQSRCKELWERKARMSERTERKPVLVEYRGHSSQVGQIMPVMDFCNKEDDFDLNPIMT